MKWLADVPSIVASEYGLDRLDLDVDLISSFVKVAQIDWVSNTIWQQMQFLREVTSEYQSVSKN